MPAVRANGLTIAYDSVGPENAEAMLLVSGLGVQMTRWSDPFCALLSDHGYRVIRFDNRDAGLSTSFAGAPVPDLMQVATAVARGARPAVPYTLFDMTADAIGLLDALGIARAHIVGRSMGGMIAQLMAARFSGRTLSLAAIMSSTGNPDLPQASPEAMAALMRPAPDPLQDREGYLAHGIAMARVIGSPAYPFDETDQRTLLAAELDRARVPGGFGRQIAAIAATGDIRRYARSINVPTLVVHGADDPLVPVAAGRDIAASIQNADLRVIEGMGHDFPPALYGTLASAIAGNARRAGASA